MAIQKVYWVCVLLLISGFFILSHSRFILLGGYKGIQGVTGGYKGLQGVTGSDKGLQGVTKDY